MKTNRLRFITAPDKVPDRRKPYWIELATLEKIAPASFPISEAVAITISRITAHITEYSAISCPSP
jgi:hypothetical protein